jgi:uncharacterized membrane protein
MPQFGREWPLLDARGSKRCEAENGMAEPEILPATRDGRAGGTVDLGLVAYVCYAAAIVFAVPILIGVVIAYLQRREAAGTWRESHYTWLIHTFWIGLLYSVVATLLTKVLIGVLLGFLVLIWFIVRVVKGWKAYDQRAPLPKPKTWLF